MGRRAVVKFGDQPFEIVDLGFGQGGQGQVHRARHSDHADRWAIIKDLPNTQENRDRLEWLIDRGIGYAIPGIAAPLACVCPSSRSKPLRYLATFSEGVSLETDQPRSLPELFEMAILLCSIWCRLEQAGIAHGDVAPSNVLVRADGWIDLIDIDNFSTAEPKVPAPQMLGQHAMVAPELRVARRQKQERAPDLFSDRFAWGVLFNLLLLGRHPADGLADNPKAFDDMMTLGEWLEEARMPHPDETPIDALGMNLMGRFREAASVEPDQRPTAEQWHKALMDGLDRLHVHECGGAFVMDHPEGRCPWCGQVYKATVADEVVLEVTVQATGQTLEFPLANGSLLYLGRDNLPGVSNHVSGRHLRLYRLGRKLYLEHTGRNPSTIQFAGESKAYVLYSFHESLDHPRMQQLTLTLGDTALILTARC